VRQTGPFLEREIANSSDWHTIIEQFCQRPSSPSSRDAHPERERWILGNWLKRGNSDPPSFPARLVQWDRPDFTIHSAAGDIGVEVTELTTQKLKDIRDLAEKHGIASYSAHPLPLDAATEKERLMKREEMRDEDLIIERVKNDQSGGFQGTFEEKKLAGMISRLVLEKHEKFAMPEFRRFDRNLLVIYDNASPAPPIMEAFERYMREVVSPCLLDLPRHQEIWLMTAELVRIAPEKLDN
jgi:hypothetical protein